MGTCQEETIYCDFIVLDLIFNQGIISQKK